MIGKLTFDKSSMNMSCFLKSLLILKGNGGCVSRQTFTEEMADFIELSAYLENGSENRTPYNKTKMPRYFGFITIDDNGDLLLTSRGNFAIKCIKDNGAEYTWESRYSINPKHKRIFQELILDSVIFDSFGKNNCGAEQSNTTIEAPKTIFKAIYNLGRATAEEIMCVVYGLYYKLYSSFEDAINHIFKIRENGNFDYDSLFEKWGVSNIVDDCKIIKIFASDDIELFNVEQENPHLFYSLNYNVISSERENQIKSISPYYYPKRLSLLANDETVIEQWLYLSLLGNQRCGHKTVFHYNYLEEDGFFGLSSSGENGIFDRALSCAYNDKNTNYYIIIKNAAKKELSKLFCGSSDMLGIIDNFSDVQNHGNSKNYITAPDTYSYVLRNTTKSDIKKALKEKHNKIHIPSNIHIISYKVMDNIDQNIEATFSSILIEDSVNDRAQVLDSTNCSVILYGPPGTGKTRRLQTEYIPKHKEHLVTTFHQAFSYEEFVEGLKPVLDDSSKEVKYKIEKGVFYEACEKAAILAEYASLAECLADTKSNRVIKFNKAIEEKKTVLLCIDEINRGNVASIFGDLISLIEPSKRLGAGELEMTATLPYSKKPFGVPANLFIVGTMNTADRSIQLLDSALRRRFKFEELLPNYDVIDNDDAEKILRKINARVRCLLNKDNQIGHSYLMFANSYCDILSALYNKIIPLLEEYFYNDIDKVRFVLNDNTNSQFYVEDTEAKEAYQLYLNEDVDGEERKFFKLNTNIAKVLEKGDERACKEYLVNLLPKEE